MIFSKKLLFVLYGLLVYSFLHYIKTGMIFSYSVPGGDWEAAWPTFWAGSLNPDIIAHKDLDHQYKIINGYSKIWLYGPFMHLLLFPFIFFKAFETASHVWFIICHFLFLTTMFFWYKMLFLDKGLHSFLSLVLYISIWFNFFPIYEALATRAPEILELFLITLAIVLYLRSKDYLSGIMLGLAAMTKFLPVGFIPYFLIKKKYKVVFFSLLMMVLVGILTEFTLKWRNSETLTLFFTQPDRIEIGKSYECQSISCFVSRFMSRPESTFTYAAIKDPVFAKKIVFPLIGFLILFFSGFFLRFKNNPITFFEIGILFVLMIGFTPQSHPYYLIFLIVPFSIALQYLIKVFHEGELKTLDVFLYSFSFWLVAVFLPLSLLKELFKFLSFPPFLNLYQYYCIPVYGYLILLFWLVVKQIQHRA